MCSLKLICLASLLAASPLAGAQTLESGAQAARIRAVQYTKAYQ